MKEQDMNMGRESQSLRSTGKDGENRMSLTPLTLIKIKIYCQVNNIDFRDFLNGFCDYFCDC